MCPIPLDLRACICIGLRKSVFVCVIRWCVLVYICSKAVYDWIYISIHLWFLSEIKSRDFILFTLYKCMHVCTLYNWVSKLSSSDLVKFLTGIFSSETLKETLLWWEKDLSRSLHLISIDGYNLYLIFDFLPKLLHKMTYRKWLQHFTFTYLFKISAVDERSLCLCWVYWRFLFFFCTKNKYSYHIYVNKHTRR